MSGHAFTATVHTIPATLVSRGWYGVQVYHHKRLVFTGVAENFVRGQRHFSAATDTFPGYIHDRVWSLIEKERTTS